MSRVAVLTVIVLGVVGCGRDELDHRINLAAQTGHASEALTYTVTGAADEGATVQYQVVTSAGAERGLRYDRGGLIAVEDEAGATTERADAADRLLGALALPHDPAVGYAALGLDQALPSASQAPDAALPVEIQQSAYEAECTRIDLGTWQEDGCTQGAYLDVCGDTVYWLWYQKRSGCFLGFFCDCPGLSDAGIL